MTHPSTLRARALLDRLDNVETDLALRRAQRLIDGDDDDERAPLSERIVRKTFAAPEPQRAATMDAQTQEQWNAWCDQRARTIVEGHTQEALAILAEQVYDDAGTIIRNVLEEIRQLRAEVERWRNLIDAKTVEALPLPSDQNHQVEPQARGRADRLPMKAVAFTLTWLLFLIGVTTPRPATASEERVDICAVYSATNKPYHVSAILATGSDLNQATRSFSYNVLSRYIVIFWAQNQASVIQMGPIFGEPSYNSK